MTAMQAESVKALVFLNFSVDFVIFLPVLFYHWYTWRVRNWGTKWDITAKIEKLGPQLKNGKRELVYTFDSAWSPPCAAFERISEDWPLLKFRLTYREEGMGVKGSETFGPHPENAVDKNSVA